MDIMKISLAGVILVLELLLAPANVNGETNTLTTWYFAEGSTQQPFETWFLVLNPTSDAASVRFTFQLQEGGPVVRDFTIGPTSRFSLYANQALPDRVFSTRIDADHQVFAERAMYVGFDGDTVPGIPAPSETWWFAEGSTQSPFQTWLLFQNPNATPAHATITYFLVQGPPFTQTLTLAPDSRTSVFVNQLLPDQAFSSRLECDQPVVVERAMYRFPGNAATAVRGVNALSATWYFADGRNLFYRYQEADTWLLLLNPSPLPVTATVTYFSGGVIQQDQFVLAPTSRRSILAQRKDRPSTYGIQVEATGAIVAERSVFVAPGTAIVVPIVFGDEPRGAFTTIGSPELGTVWAFPEGSTAAPFSENIIILNPNDQRTAVHFQFFLPGGQVIKSDYGAEPRSRTEIDIRQWVRDTAASTIVTTDLPTVAERVTDFMKTPPPPGPGTIPLGVTDALGLRLQ